MRKLLHLILLLVAFSFAQSTSLAVWLTTSGSLTKDECVFLSEIIMDGAKAEVPSVKVLKGKKNPADYYVESSVTKMGSKFHIKVELYRTQGTQLLNSFSNRTNDVDQLTDDLEKAMKGFFDAVLENNAQNLQEPAESPVAEDATAPKEPAAPTEESAEFTDVAEVAAPAEEPAPKIEIDLSNIQYFDNGKSGVLAPTGAADPSYNQYETFVWSNVVTSGVGADGGAGSSGGKSGGLPTWVKVLPYALGAGFLIAGIVENGQIEKERENYDNASDPDSAQKYWDNLEFLRSARNVFYGVGLGLVGAGVVITVAF